MLTENLGEVIWIDDIGKQLEKMVEKNRIFTSKGKIADYIPALKTANADHLGVSICLVSGDVWEAGDVDIPFTMQSISKVLSLALALMDHGEQPVFRKVGMEPTGDPFNSIIKLEISNPNKPLNPMINAGAIAVTSLLKGNSTAEKVERLLQLIRTLAHNPAITYNAQVAQSEAETADLNRALSYFMREHHVIQCDVDEVLDVYFKQCAIEVSCRDLARIGAVFANGGKDLVTEKQIIPEKVARICKTFMVTCGMYNASGEFAIQVGIPAKSGVSGGILGAVPFKMGIGVYSPALDEKGNSMAGIHLLETMSTRWQLSIF